MLERNKSSLGLHLKESDCCTDKDKRNKGKTILFPPAVTLLASQFWTNHLCFWNLSNKRKWLEGV